MTHFSADLTIPATARYQKQEIEEILHAVQEGTYVAVLGPRLCGKTVMLRFVERVLIEELGFISIYIDLMDLKASTLVGFFAELIDIISQRYREQPGLSEMLVPEGYISSAGFRGFLTELVEKSGRDLVLIIEHLEVVPTDLVQSLLTSLRAAYMDQQTMENRTTVVVSGALSLATLTVGESSPFRGIAKRVFVGDLSDKDSMALISEYLQEGSVTVTRQAQRRLLRATNGDHFLIRKISQRSINLVRATASNRLQAGNVNQVMTEFLRDEVFSYAPLLEAAHLIEEDPDLIQCILLLLEQGVVHKSRLPLPLSPDLDPLYLTGVVERVDGDSYRLQNQIYRQFLEDYFHPGRVGQAMATAGRWDLALDYLETGVIKGDEQARAGLISATMNSIYASEDLERAAHFLTRGLLGAFGMEEVQVWYAIQKDRTLRLLSQMGAVSDESLWENPEISIIDDRLEARAFRQAASLRGIEVGNHIRRVVPLMLPGNPPLGVVTISDILSGERFIDQRERDRQLGAYLNQAARAFQAVAVRRQELALAGRMQLSLVTEVPPELTGWDVSAQLIPARETCGDFYDFIPLSGGRLGILIADVSDKGLGAALYMALSRTLVRTYAPDYPDRPDIVLEKVSSRILSDTQGGMFVTTFYGVLDPINGQISYCNAGHNPPFLIEPNSPTEITPLLRTGMALGVATDAQWQTGRITIREEGVLLLYTDGLVDARQRYGEMLGDEGLKELMLKNYGSTARHIRDGILSGMREFVGDEGQFDDIALVVVRRLVVKPLPAKKVTPYSREVV